MLKLTSFTCIIGLVLSTCPHERPTLKRWSNPATWKNIAKPVHGESINITEGILLDEDVDLYNITITNTGSLVFDPTVEDLKVRVANVYVYGSFEIGHEECPYNSHLTITLTGTREIHNGEKESKVILALAGGTIEMHGERKLTWTKVNNTLLPASENTDIFFDHSKVQVNEEHNWWVSGITAYTFAIEGGVPVQKKFGVYDLHWHTNDITSHINDVQEGEILVMSSQRKIRQPSDSDKVSLTYDALETLVYGDVTESGLLRHVNDAGETWAFVYQKGNPSSLVEVKHPLGTSSYARFEIDGYVFSAEAIGQPHADWQYDNIRVGTRDDIYPKLTVVDDVTTWLPGDRVVITSTDYDHNQAEEAIVVECSPEDCSNTEVRIDGIIKYTHWGEIVHEVDMRAEVAVLTRLVVIEGEMEPTCPSFNGNCDAKEVEDRDTFGGHVKVLKDYANARFENIELRNVGHQTDLGRYPIHFHLALDKIPSASDPYIKGCSMHNSFSRCVTIHGTHKVLVADNVCYNFMGHGYFLEDGGEKDNIFDGNLAINCKKGTGDLEPLDKTLPSGFWITNPLTTFINNVAAGGVGTGIWFIYPEEPLPPSRQFNLMEKEEASRTMITAFSNNVAHSNDAFGIMIGDVLQDNRNNHCCNKWQPRVDPKDKTSTPLPIPLDKITCFKNRFNNLWIEGGLLNVTHISVADSVNGMIISNEGQQDRFAGNVSHSVVIGESVNKGVPTEGFNRSLPFFWETTRVQSGVTMWKGPTKFSHMWFDKFQSNPNYDIAAIAKFRESPYFFSILNSFNDTYFAFDDSSDGGTYAISGTKDLPGWEKNKDGELISGMTYFDHDGSKTYMVKPDPFSAAAPDCELRPNWRLAMCTTKYGNLRLTADFKDKHVVFVRDDVPSAQLEFEMKTNTGPQVVMDGSHTYTVHFPQGITDWMMFTAPGLDKGDKLRFGLCTPRGAEVEIQSFHPYNLWQESRFTRVNSLAELDAEDDTLGGKKYFLDEQTGMLYYKFINTETRSPDEPNTCNDRNCPQFIVRVLSGDFSDTDCRSRLYTSDELDMETPILRVYNETIVANGPQTPPVGYGAGSTRPFSSRVRVDGGFSDWTSWSKCSKECGDGEQFKTRQCNNPLPENGGDPCDGDMKKTRACFIEECPIDGGFSEWSGWSMCRPMVISGLKCSGIMERSRVCNKPAPDFGGKYCEGYVKEYQSCSDCFPVII